MLGGTGCCWAGKERETENDRERGRTQILGEGSLLCIQDSSPLWSAQEVPREAYGKTRPGMKALLTQAGSHPRSQPSSASPYPLPTISSSHLLPCGLPETGALQFLPALTFPHRPLTMAHPLPRTFSSALASPRFWERQAEPWPETAPSEIPLLRSLGPYHQRGY